MPLRAIIPKGRATYYLRGSVKAGQRSRSVYESTGVSAGDPGARHRAEEIRLRREGELYHELLHGPQAIATFTEVAASYGDKRARERVARNPALAGRPDKEMEYVAKWVRFLRARGVSDISLDEFAQVGKRHIDAYFSELHIAKKHKLSTMHRENDTYETVMNFAVSKKWAPETYPRAELPKWDIAEQPVNKWLYSEEVRLFIRLAPKHLRLFVSGLFATGIRGGELLYATRRQPNYGDPNSTGISLEPGREHIYLGWTKSRKPVIRTLPDWWVAMLAADFIRREDSHDALFLTEDGVPYKRPRKQRGFAVKTAWRRLRRRVAAVIARLACIHERNGDKLSAARLRDRAATSLKVTPHWGRHNAASHLTMKGMADSAVQRGGGWHTAAMVRRYQHLAPEASKSLANALDFSRPVRAGLVQATKRK